jgi:hypothetical protein
MERVILHIVFINERPPKGTGQRMSQRTFTSGWMAFHRE